MHIMKNIIIAQNREHLQLIIQQEIELYGNECNLNHINTSLVTDMSLIFYKSKFNGNINQWNTSHVAYMYRMFSESEFNGDISQWDVSQVKDMDFMFTLSHFIPNIDNWNVSNVTNMYEICKGCECMKPWWAIEDNEQRKIAINNYQLMSKLEDKLISKKDIQPKKIKI